jgi:hypothetical protein
MDDEDSMIDHAARSGQESIAQGLPWVSQNKRFALKGLQRCPRYEGGRDNDPVWPALNRYGAYPRVF